MEIKMHTAELIEGIEAPEINTKRKQKTAVPTNFDQAEEDQPGRRDALINFTIVVGGMALLNTLLFYVLLQLST